ncbi:recombination protein O N-terminal domain-containing protein [Wolbachia endosymbiont of Onchocerca volvulus]|nr:recombination protein O N-terminal domain-containing protein [Wolbachia endosymbiont of Onchocerca volvulus]
MFKIRCKDGGIIITFKKYGDKDLILSLFTKSHGECRELNRAKHSNHKF